MDHNNTLVESLQKCVTACEYCADACLDEDNVSSMVDCIRIDRNCADICSTSLRLLIRNSNRAKSVVEICQGICAECAEECEKHDHEHCQECARACRRCEEQCREYLNRSTVSAE